jgi:hypothetical protein
MTAAADGPAGVQLDIIGTLYKASKTPTWDTLALKMEIAMFIETSVNF